MATKIVTKNSSTASAVPTASDLVQGELAVNVADKRLFTEDNTGTIVELGTNPSTIDINAGSIDGTAIGASSASTGAFTTLTATGLTVDTNTLYVDSTNNRVGIGTSSPSTELHVDGSITYDGRLRPHSTASDGSAAVPAIVVGYDYDTGLYHPASNTIGFSTGGSERMRIDSSGNVGIGTSSPTFKLDVAGNARANYFALRANESAPSESAFVYRPATGVLGFGTSSAERMRIDSSGNVGIGTSSPAEELHVVGDIVATGNVTAYYSDEQLKDFQGTIPNALGKVAQLNGYYYTPNEEAKSLGVKDKGVEVGVSAQEVQAVLPEIVTDSVVGEGYKTVWYDKLTPLLIEAIKELKAEVEELKRTK